MTPKLRRLLVGGAFAVLAFPFVAPVLAQPLRESRGAPAGQFDFYVLSLSWSPGFCEAGGSVKGRSQCDSGAGLGFVVHGLWPQYQQGYPSFCEPGGRFVSRPALAQADGVFPDDGLARYEWRRHGTCSGLGPAEYFRAARRARALIRIPDSLLRPKSDAKVLPIDIERAFAEANPGLRPDMMSVQCGRRVFQELRICLDRDLRAFRSCPEVDRDGCRAGEITVKAVR